MPSSKPRPFTARFDEELYEELQTVTQLQRRSINQFVIAAVKQHLRVSRGDLIQRYGSALSKLQEYARDDTDFEEAIQAFAEAETVVDDPVDGRITPSKPTEQSPAEAELLNILADGA